MSIISLAEFQDYARNEIVSADDTLQQWCVDSAEESIREFCSRDFTLADSVATQRMYSPPQLGWNVLRIHDCVEITQITQWDVVLVSNTWQAEPLNNMSWSGDYRPIEQVRRFYYPWLWDFGRARIGVTARWGWDQIPSRVKEATLIMAKDIYQQRNTNSGVAGFSEYGAIKVRMNPIAIDLLQKFRRQEAVGLA